MHAKLNILLVLAITIIAVAPSCHARNPDQASHEPSPAPAPLNGEAADRRETQKQTDLFTNDATIEVYDSEPGKTKPRAIIHGHAELAEGFATLKNIT